jgi:hypothetical protein
MEVVPDHMLILFTALDPKFCITPFFRPLPAPSNTIRIKIPHETDNPVSVVRSLFFLSVSNIS